MDKEQNKNITLTAIRNQESVRTQDLRRQYGGLRTSSVWQLRAEY